MLHDEEIIFQKLKEGDYKVYQYIYDTYVPYLLTFTFRFVADEEASKDIVQETFIGLWEKRNKIEIISLRNYLYTTARNKCLLHLRYLKIKDKHQFYIIDSYLFDHTETDIFDEEIKSDILKAVDNLPKKMKRIFRAKYIHELSVKEIAEDFDLSENTVATQLKRARRKIRTYLLHKKI